MGDRYSIAIRQNFIDRQEKDSFNIDMFVSGTLPQLNHSTIAAFSDFEETYQKEGPGLFMFFSYFE